VTAGVVDKQLAIEGFAGVTAMKCWYQLALFIRKRREDRGYYAESFEAFAYLAFEYFKKRKIYLEFKNDFEKVHDLVKKFEGKGFEYPPRRLKEIIKKEREKEQN
jgi:hypothetical protein